jgi:3,4-dihydroxy 2-butanone 4-phosphate synthase/GTP cyclohydrolase II
MICLSLPGSRIDALGLRLDVDEQLSRHETALPFSIEAREGHHWYQRPRNQSVL